MRTTFQLLFFILIFLSSFCFGQKEDITQLEKKLSSSDQTEKCIALNKLASAIMYTDTEKAKKYADEVVLLAKTIGNNEQLALAYCNLSAFYSQKGDVLKAKRSYYTSLNYFNETKDQKRIANVFIGIAELNYYESNFDSAILIYKKALPIIEGYKNSDDKINAQNGIAACYYQMGNYDKALNYYLQNLRVAEEAKNNQAVAQAKLNIGSIYYSQQNPDKALGYYEQALVIFRELKDKAEISTTLSNLANIYTQKGSKEKAIDYLIESLTLRRELGNESEIAATLMNIGNVYVAEKNFSVAAGYYEEAKSLYEKNNEQNGLSETYINLGITYNKSLSYNKAETYLLKGLEIASLTGRKELVKAASEELTDVYEHLGDFKKALEYHKKYSSFKDSLISEEKVKSLTEMSTKYETEKKEKALLIQESELKQNKFQRNVLMGGILMMILLAVFIFRSYLQKQKVNKALETKNQIIEEQKKVVEHKNNEIIDSINYASRIQRSLLSSDVYRKKYFKDHFIFYKPKDIVAGDFYWMSEKNGKTYFVCADCTGHGVPGAFMSLLGINHLNEIVGKRNETETGKIVDLLKAGIISSLNPEGVVEEAKDGMDAVLCRFDFQNYKMQYTAANNCIYVLRNNELIEFPADKMPVGHSYQNASFTTHDVDLQVGDMVYMFTDGFPDQFGGPKEKKFKYKQLKELLIAHANKPLEQQHQLLQAAFENWKGNTEQTDDVCVVGIKIS